MDLTFAPNVNQKKKRRERERRIQIVNHKKHFKLWNNFINLWWENSLSALFFNMFPLTLENLNFSSNRP